MTSEVPMVAILPSGGIRITVETSNQHGAISINSVSINDPKEVTWLYTLLCDVIEYYETH